ncbi:MAG: serine/threonine-protein kinase [Actinomycetales bacterium]|jgi:serine/threonine-protein kinase|nr:MAG: serine/threonine-protein kinase [Actinomycetales bacterium]
MAKIFGNRYKIGGMIGTGGMADVYIGDDQRLSRKVAVKVLRSDLARDPSFLSRFRKEALAAAGLNHPGIVAVYDSGEEGQNSYIVMELVNGHTLREVLQSPTTLTVERSLEIIEGVLIALSYSHENGIIHRDIKPGNIMLTDSGDVKVMDFGIARAMDDIGATMTSTWNVVGTAQYLSPEQATGEACDLRSDIYSVGCLLYELVTGRPPFTGDTPVAIAYQHVSSDFPIPSAVNPELDENIDKIITVALAKNPGDRYQSAEMMLSDIRRAMKGQSVTTKIRRIVPRRNFLVMGSAAVVFILLIGFAVNSFNSSSPAPSLQIPNVIGLTQSAAEELLSGYTINIQRAPDSRIPKDRVASQLPLATTRAPKGSSITLTISDGPGDTTVPITIIGLSLEEARNELSAAGLLITQIIPVDSNSRTGVVLKITPDAGSIIKAGSGVVLEIASGNVKVPELLDLTGIEAQTILTQAGFLVKEISAYDETKPIGVVLAQAPEAETTQLIGSDVAITVNRKP